MYAWSIPPRHARSVRPAAMRRTPACPDVGSTAVVGRRIVQSAVDVVVSTVLAATAMSLFVLLPTHTDGSIRSGALTTAIATAVVLLAFVILLCYWVVRPAQHDGRTWGMQLLGIRVVDMSGGRVSPGRLTLRWLLLFVDGLALGAVGLVAMLVSERRQRLGDLAAYTLVVRGRAPGLDRDLRGASDVASPHTS